MTTYSVASGSTGQASISLPIQRRVIPARALIAPSSAPAQSLGRVPASSPPAWPPAPEQPPLFAPQTQPLFPPAPAALPSPGWPSAHSPVTSSPFGIASTPLETAQPTLASPFSSSVPETPFSLSPLDFSPAQAVPVSLPYEPRSDWQPPRDERNVPLGLLLILVLGLSGWLFWENTRPPMAAEFEAPQPASPQKPVSKPEVPQINPPAMKQVTPAPVPEMQEVRRAESVTKSKKKAVDESSLDLVAADAAAKRLMDVLLKGRTIEERLSAIALPEEHRVDVEEFFARTQPKIKSLKLSEVTPHTLPGQEPVPMLLVTTDINPKRGALVKLVPQLEGGFLMDWPLFAETHNGFLAGFLETQSDQPSWCHVILRRSHALNLEKAVRDQYFCVELQGSSDGSTQCFALTALETPLGRFLEREVEWGDVHVARLLLQHRELVGGVRSIVILDCEGAVTGAVFPSGTVKD